jgi:hypothetical protein
MEHNDILELLLMKNREGLLANNDFRVSFKGKQNEEIL